MRTIIIVPRREGIAERDLIWAWCRQRWEALHPDLPIYEGHHTADEGPFNRSAAINRAAAAAGDWDLAVIVDADVFLAPEQVVAAIRRAAKTGKVVWAFQWWCGSEKQTAARIITGDLTPENLLAELTALYEQGTPNEMGTTPVPDVLPDGFEKINPISWSCCFVVPRAAFDRLGGFDERFAGWGWEDLAFQSAACGLIGWERISGPLVHLWHPRAPGLGDDGVTKRRNRQLGRRYMHALRVKGLHDRAVPSDDEEMARDRRNIVDLMAREEVDRHGNPSRDLPDWRGWLPSLEELIDSWKSRRPAGPPPRISVVVRTGGDSANWPERSGYLERMLASLDEHVRVGGQTLVDSPSVVRMALFSDWDPQHTPDLASIAMAHGFYVVGSGNVGFTPSMQKLWRYLGSRQDPFDYVLLVEDDFAFERPVDLLDLVAVLADRPHLVQMALLRDACYEAEREKGGILGHPDEAFARERDGDATWLEHQRFFTLNPTLFRRSLTENPWPEAQHSEAVFGRRLWNTDGRRRAALWGEGEAWVTHLGEVRAGAGY